MKTCPRCRREHKGKLGYCRECWNRYQVERRLKMKQQVMTAMGVYSCQRCGFTPVLPEDHAAIDFHHHDPAGKEAGVSDLIRRSTLDAAIEEARKCQVLCANCHRILHAS